MRVRVHYDWTVAWDGWSWLEEREQLMHNWVDSSLNKKIKLLYIIFFFLFKLGCFQEHPGLWVASPLLVRLFFGLYSYFSISCYSVLALLLLFVMYYCCSICKNTLRSLSTLLHLLLSYFLLINLLFCIPKYVNYELFYY